MHVGTSLDQMYAQRFGQDTPIPSMQLVHRERRSGRRLRLRLLLRLHRHDQLGEPDAAAADGARSARRVRSAVRRRRQRPPSAPRAAAPTAASSTGSPPKCRGCSAGLGPADRARLERVSRRTSARSSAASRRSRRTTASGEARELPEAPIGVPDSFDEHVKLMFDLQALAFAVRHHARLLVQDGPRRLEPRLSRRAASTGRSTPRRITASARIASRSSRRSTSTTSAWCRTSSRS